MSAIAASENEEIAEQKQMADYPKKDGFSQLCLKSGEYRARYRGYYQ